MSYAESLPSCDSLEKAAEVIARASVVGRRTKHMQKAANGFQDMLGAAGRFVGDHPLPFLGAGLGAAVGGGSALLRKDRNKNIAGNALTGAIAGGGAGLGGEIAGRLAGFNPTVDAFREQLQKLLGTAQPASGDTPIPNATPGPSDVATAAPSASPDAARALLDKDPKQVQQAYNQQRKVLGQSAETWAPWAVSGGAAAAIEGPGLYRGATNKLYPMSSTDSLAAVRKGLSSLKRTDNMLDPAVAEHLQRSTSDRQLRELLDRLQGKGQPWYRQRSFNPFSRSFLQPTERVLSMPGVGRFSTSQARQLMDSGRAAIEKGKSTAQQVTGTVGKHLPKARLPLYILAPAIMNAMQASRARQQFDQAFASRYGIPQQQ